MCKSSIDESGVVRGVESREEEISGDASMGERSCVDRVPTRDVEKNADAEEGGGRKCEEEEGRPVLRSPARALDQLVRRFDDPEEDGSSVDEELPSLDRREENSSMSCGESKDRIGIVEHSSRLSTRAEERRRKSKRPEGEGGTAETGE